MPRRFFSQASLALFFSLIALGVHAQDVTRTLGFDPPHVEAGGGAVREQGFIMDTLAGVSIDSGGTPNTATNGTRYAAFLQHQGSFTVVHRDGLPFTALKVDLGRYGATFTPSVTFLGKKADNSTVSVTVPLQGIGDGAGPLPDFQSFTFPASFAHIVKLEVPGTGYLLDNLQVTVHGAESTELPAPAPPLVYDIDWNGAPHSLNQPTATGGPRAPSTVFFGKQYVRNQIGPLKDRPLELSQKEAMYDQFGLTAGMNAGRYVLEFDVAFAGDGSLSVYQDHTHGFLNSTISSNGVIYHSSLTSPGGPSGGGSETLFSPQIINRFRFDFNPAGGIVEVAANGNVIAQWTVPAGAAMDLTGIRFSLSGDGPVGVDNVKFSAYERPKLTATPAGFDFQSVPVGGSRTAAITLVNTGDAPVTLTGADFPVPEIVLEDITFPLELGPQDYKVITLRAQPTIAQSFSGRGRIFTADGGAVQIRWNLQGTLPVSPGTFNTHPASSIVETGALLSLTTAFTSPVATFQWFKDGAALQDATGTSLSLTPASDAGAGLYQVRATNGGQTYSHKASVGVITFTNISKLSAQGTQVQVTAVGTGPGLHFAWRHKGRVLSGTEPGITISGATLTIDPVLPEHEGLFTATAQMLNERNGTLVTKEALRLALTVPQRPQITVQDLRHWQVGASSQVIVTTTRPATIQAAGLPDGLTIDEVSGVISGAPSAASAPNGVPVRYPVTLTVGNEFGDGVPVTLDLWVYPVPVTTMNLIGLIAPGQLGVDARQLGGTLRMAITSGGRYTATVRVPLATLTGTGTLTFRAADGVMAGVLKFRTRDYTLEYPIQVDAYGHLRSEDSLGTPNGDFEAWPVVKKLNLALHRSGLYPTALLPFPIADLGQNLPEYLGFYNPGGAGILNVRVTANGRASFAGQLADGTSVTGGEALVGNPENPAELYLPIFLNAPANRGSAVGWFVCNGGELDGELAWQKTLGTRDTSYREGFNGQTLYAIGDLQPTTARSTHAALMGIASSTQAVSVTGADLVVDREARFSIAANYRATFLSAAPIPAAKATLTVQPTTATFRGSFDVDTYRGMPVRANYQGVFIPRLGIGIGFCLTPDVTLMRSYSGARQYRSALVQLSPLAP